ncbi:MAG: peptidoglycan recognition family protein [Polyangiaceae bacterium]
MTSLRCLLFAWFWTSCLIGLTACGSSPAPSSARAELSGESLLVAEFQRAERASGVPAELLAAIAFAQTRFSMHPAGAAQVADEHMPREVGLMAIGTGGLTSVEVAALLARRPVSSVESEPGANIHGAAALLAEMGRARGVTKGDDLSAWVEVVEGYGGNALVADVRSLLRTGFDGRDDEGLRVHVSGVGLEGEELGVAVSELGYPGAKWSAAYSGNYTAASRGASQIDYVVIHTTQGSYAGAISWFKNSSANVSAHYVVRSSDGQITQMVDDSDIAWHDKCFNSESIGIEHEGYVENPSKWYTEAMYKASAKLTRWLADQYKIPKDKKHILGHGEAPDCSDHTDPGKGWDWAHYMDLVVNGECSPKTEVCNGKDDDCDGKVDEGDVCNDPPKGALESVSCESLKGYAQDPDAPKTSIDVHLYFGGPAGGGVQGHPVHADAKRDDLCTKLGSCKHGFDIEPPLSLFDGKPHAVHAYGIDSAGGKHAELTGSPKTLQCTAGVPSGVRRHVVDAVSLAAWKLDPFWDALPLSEAQIESLAEADDWPATPKLVQADDGSPEVWLVDAEWRRHVPDAATMAVWQLAFDTVEKLPAADVKKLLLGPELRERPVLVRSESGRIDMIDTPLPSPAPPAKTPDPKGSGGTGNGGAGGGAGWSATDGVHSDASETDAACSVSSRRVGGASPLGFVCFGVLAAAGAAARRRSRAHLRAA